MDRMPVPANDEHTAWRERQLMLNEIAALGAEVERLREERLSRVDNEDVDNALAEIERLQKRHLTRPNVVQWRHSSGGDGLVARIPRHMPVEERLAAAQCLKNAHGHIATAYAQIDGEPDSPGRRNRMLCETLDAVDWIRRAIEHVVGSRDASSTEVET